MENFNYIQSEKEKLKLNIEEIQNVLKVFDISENILLDNEDIYQLKFRMKNFKLKYRELEEMENNLSVEKKLSEKNLYKNGNICTSRTNYVTDRRKGPQLTRRNHAKISKL